MNIAPRYMGISRQIILIVLLIMVFVTVGLAIVIGVTSFNNLSTLKLDELERMSRILSSRVQELQQNAAKSVAGIENNQWLSERLEQLTNLGPYYYSDSAQQGQKIDEAEKIYALQAQLEIVQALQPLINLHQLSSISLFNLSPYGQLPDASPVLNMRLDSEGLWVGQFNIRGSAGSRLYHYVHRLDYQPPAPDFFDVSSVYQLTVKDFYRKIRFQVRRTTGFDELFSEPLVSEASPGERTGSKVINIDGIPVIRTWAPVFVPVSNPETWETERRPAVLVVLEQAIEPLMLTVIKKQLGIDIALAIDDEILVSSLPKGERLGILGGDQKVVSSRQDFYYAGQPVSFERTGKLERPSHALQAVVLSPISVLSGLTRTLFMQMTAVAGLATFLAGAAVLWTIRRLVNRPLRRLMTGVEKISAGDLAHQVHIKSDNELGQLASAFNIMSTELAKKSGEAKRSAESLITSNSELQRYQTTLEEMVEQRTNKLKQAQKQLIESEKMASLGELVAGVAHEINTPVGVGVTAASFLTDETRAIHKKYVNEEMTREDFDEYLKCTLQTTEMILSNLQRATELVKSFKQVAVDQTAEDRRRFSLRDYIEEVLTTLHPRLKKTSHSIEITGDKAIEIDSYPGCFSQIITNLIMNSIVHGFAEGEAGQIRMDLRQQGDEVVLTYSDSGRGIGDDDLSRIFDPFFTTRRGQGGTGLGLHIVYNLVTQKLMGAIKCESRPGDGTRFTLTLPSIGAKPA